MSNPTPIPTVPTIRVGAAPTRNANVKILFRVIGADSSGLIGESDAGIWFQCSIDDGVTYYPSTNLGTDDSITLPVALGIVIVDFTSGNGEGVVDGGYLTFTTTVVNAGTCSYLACSTDALTAAVTVGGTPDDAYEVLVQSVTGGATGTTGITYKVSLDDGRGGMSATYALGTATSITVPGTGGLVITLGSATVWAAGATIRVTTQAPGWTAGTMQDALDMLPGYTGDWEQFTAVGACNTTTFAAVDALMNRFAASLAKDRYAELSFRCPQPGEDEATYQAAYAAFRAQCVSTLGYTGLSMGSIQCVTSGISYRRELGFVAAAKIASVPEQVNVGQRQAPGGPLPGCSFGVSQSGVPDHDEYNSPGPDDLQVITATSYPDLPGVYVTWPWTAAAPGSDFGVVTRRRVMNSALAAVRTYCANLKAKDLFTDISTGFLTGFERDRLNKGASAAGARATKGKASGVKVVFASDDNLLTNPPSPLNATLNLVPKGEVHDVNLQAQFSATLK